MFRFGGILKMVNDKNGNPTLDAVVKDVIVNGVNVRLRVNPELLKQTGCSIEDIAAGTERMTADLLERTGNSGQPLSQGELDLITLHNEADRLGVPVAHLEIDDDGQVYNAHEVEKVEKVQEAARPGFLSSLWSTVKGAYRTAVKIATSRPAKVAAAVTLGAILTGCGANGLYAQPVDLDAQPLDGGPVLSNPGLYSSSPGTLLLASNDANEEWGDLFCSLNLNLKDRRKTTVLETGETSERESNNGAGFGITYLGRFTDDRELAARILFFNATSGIVKDNGVRSGTYSGKRHLYAISYQDLLGGDDGGFFFRFGAASVGDETTTQDDQIGTLTFPERIDTGIATRYEVQLGGEGQSTAVDVRGALVWRGEYDNDNDRGDNTQTLGGKVTAQFANGEAYAAILNEETDESERHPGIDPHSRTLIEFGGMGEFGSATDREGGLNGYIILDLSGVSRIGGAGFGGYWVFGGDNGKGILKANITYEANNFTDSDEKVESEGVGLTLSVGYSH